LLHLFAGWLHAQVAWRADSLAAWRPGTISLVEKSVELPLVGFDGEVALPDSFLISGSEIAWVDSIRLHRGQDYEMDYLRGIFRFTASPGVGRTLRIVYKIIPVSLSRVYFHRRRVVAKPEAAPESHGSDGRLAALPKPRPASGEFLPSNLRKSGSIVRGVSVGSNQNLSVDSGLRMQISGQLANNVEVVASLTDQDTPIQPEGNTQTLQEIDKVFIQVKSPNVEATLGDYNFKLDGGEFTRYDRKLEGVKGVVTLPNVELKASAAVSRGQFRTNEFLGQEGNQGPYQLTGENGNVNILVLAGTERVWIDGEEMARGENLDYVIEYGNGQITFTRNRLITSDSRITVDFQFSDESFQKNYLAARGKTMLFDERVEFSTTFIRESDDRNDPLTLDINDQRLAALESSGDSLAITPGWTFVGPDSGAYSRDDAGIFTFVGSGSGDFDVIFSFFGPGKGDYRNVGLGRFEYVGEGLGDYRPFVILPQAQRHDIVGIDLNAAPAKGLNIKSELAFSNFDQNLYSNVDDNDNLGSAYNLVADFRPQQVRVGGLNLGRFDLSGRLRHKTAHFRDVDRTTIAEFNRRWNIDSSRQTAEESITEISGDYVPVPGFSLGGGFGRLSKTSAFESQRWEVRTRLDREHLPKISHFVEFINRDNKQSGTSDWLRQKGNAEYQLKWVKPFFQFEGEVRKDSQKDTTGTGFRYDSYTTGLQLSPWRSLFATVTFNLRDDDDRGNGVFTNKSIARTQSYKLGLRNWHALNVNASFIHRTRDFSDLSVQDTRTDLADVRVAYRPKRFGVRANVNYQISNTQVARQEEVFLEVAEGDGNFRFNEELQEFEPDPFGNFVRRLFSTKNFTPVIELRMRTDLKLTPAKFFRKSKVSPQKHVGLMQRILSPLTTETFVRIDERTTEKDVAKIYLLQLGSFQQDSTTILGSIEFRQDIHLWENSRNFSLRYRYRGRNELNNQFVNGGQDREVREHGLRIIRQLNSELSVQLNFKHSKEDRIFQSIAREDRRIRANELKADLVYRFQRKWELGTKMRVSSSQDLVPDPHTKATLLALAPRLNYTLSRKGRARGEIEFTNVSLSPAGQFIPFELTEGNRAGTTLRWNFGFDYRVSQNVQASLTYFGRKEPNRPDAQHIAKMEMRAFF